MRPTTHIPTTPVVMLLNMGSMRKQDLESMTKYLETLYSVSSGEIEELDLPPTPKNEVHPDFMAKKTPFTFRKMMELPNNTRYTEAGLMPNGQPDPVLYAFMLYSGLEAKYNRRAEDHLEYLVVSHMERTAKMRSKAAKRCKRRKVEAKYEDPTPGFTFNAAFLTEEEEEGGELE